MGAHELDRPLGIIDSAAGVLFSIVLISNIIDHTELTELKVQYHRIWRIC